MCVGEGGEEEEEAYGPCFDTDTEDAGVHVDSKGLFFGGLL